MPSLVDLFNPTLLIFLGILVLVVALLVVYFESKMRDQNHKIASVVSLVSTLADDMNGVKMGLNHLIMTGGHMLQPQQPPIFHNNLGNIEEKRDLIVVSDDEESEKEDSDNDDSDSEESDNVVIDDSSEIDIGEDSSDDNNDNDDNDDNDDESKTDKNIKILKLNISNEEQETEVNNDFDLEEHVDLGGDFEPVDELPEISNEYVDEILDLKYNEESKSEKPLEEHKDITSTDFKTISINLGEENNNNNEGIIDYKKLQLPKLRSIVVEKGLASNIDVAKLKKPELLKLLGVE